MLLDEYVHYYNYGRPAVLDRKSPVQYNTEPGFNAMGFKYLLYLDRCSPIPVQAFYTLRIQNIQTGWNQLR